jgi:hypothetical protein
MSSKIEVVIPIGNGNPELGVPNVDLLIEGLMSIKNQTIPVMLTVAMDTDVSDEIRKNIYYIADKVVIFPSASYYRAGGIWSKIWECWKQSRAKYVAWQGYDDISALNRFDIQLEAIERESAKSCFGINHKFTDNIAKSTLINDGSINFVDCIGAHPEFMACFLIDRRAILSTDLRNFQYRWSHYFEGLFFAYIMSLGMPARSDGRFYFRTHLGSMANTCNPAWVESQRQLTGYSYKHCIDDWNSIGFDIIAQITRKMYEN